MRLALQGDRRAVARESCETQIPVSGWSLNSRYLLVNCVLNGDENVHNSSIGFVYGFSGNAGTESRIGP